MGNKQNGPANLSALEEFEIMNLNISVEKLVEKIKNNEFKKIMIMAGAGISVSAGIPDFRTPGSGLYDNLQKYDLPDPEAMFDINFFKENPQPFYDLAKELYPGNFKPTPTHFFIKLLDKKGMLLRCYTQNIDTLEQEANIPAERTVEAHGCFASASCIACQEKYTKEWVREYVISNQIPYCIKCDNIPNFVKPDIVFFGEDLPDRFRSLKRVDTKEADLLIIMGTSLSVSPFCYLMDELHGKAPRLLINREKRGVRDVSGHGFRFDKHDNYRDICLELDCDHAIGILCEALGWTTELIALMEEARAPIPSFLRDSDNNTNNNDEDSNNDNNNNNNNDNLGLTKEKKQALLKYNWRGKALQLPPLQKVHASEELMNNNNNNNNNNLNDNLNDNCWKCLFRLSTATVLAGDAFTNENNEVIPVYECAGYSVLTMVFHVPKEILERMTDENDNIDKHIMIYLMPLDIKRYDDIADHCKFEGDGIEHRMRFGSVNEHGAKEWEIMIINKATEEIFARFGCFHVNYNQGNFDDEPANPLAAMARRMAAMKEKEALNDDDIDDDIDDDYYNSVFGGGVGEEDTAEEDNTQLSDIADEITDIKPRFSDMSM